MQTTAAKVLAMSEEQFKAHAWAILTNRGASRKAKAAAQRRFRRMGGKAFLSFHSNPDGYEWTSWGFIFPGEKPDSEGDPLIFEGVTLDHAAHILGGGDARKGWRMYWGYWGD